jgi:very-short-patch-repair endonuclease
MPTAERPGVGSADAPSIREQLVGAARDSWVDRLIDTSRRNNLLFFRSILGGTIEIPDGNKAFLELLAGATVQALALLQSPQDRPNRVLNIARKAQENVEEKGLQTLYLAVGFATWKAEDGGRDYRAPVFLIPLGFKRKGTEQNSVEVHVTGGAQVNPVLLHIFYQKFGLRVDAEELLPEFDDEEPHKAPAESESPLSPYATKLASLSALAATGVPDFRTEVTPTISNFAFAKMAMVNDLKEAATLLVDHPLIAAIAGDQDARASLTKGQVEIDPRALDSHSPDDEFCVVEADSSQQCAIDGIAAGQSAVVHGPPGTGKSQTITNLIATLVGRGKTVLFVAEKRAALEVVQQRLHRSKLGHLAIDLHGAELSSKKVMQQVAETLATVRNARLPDSDALHREFSERRARLNVHDKRMHTRSMRTGLTLYDMQSKLLSLPVAACSEVRWRGTELERLTPAKRQDVRTLLQDVGVLASLFTRTEKSPWTGVSFVDGAVAQSAIDTARRLANDALPTLAFVWEDLADSLGFPTPQGFEDAAKLLELMRAVERQLATYSSEAYASDLSPLTTQTRRGAANVFASLCLSIFSSEYKNAVREATVLRRGAKVPAATLTSELDAITVRGTQWRDLSGGQSLPTVYPALDRLEAVTGEAHQLARSLQAVRGANWDGISFEQLAQTVAPFAKDELTPYRLLKLNGLESQLSDAGAQRLVEDIRRRQPAPRSWPDCFDFAWISSAVDELAIRDPEVKGFVGDAHNGCVQDFKRLDADRLKMAVERVRRAHAMNAIRAMNEHPQQEALIKAEAAKARRHRPLRSLFGEAWEVLTAVCPCWMASPLSVSQLLDRGSRFDYVIFDEASQVLPEDAVPAIMRGRQIVVAGDNQQLPPTGFFASGIDEEDEEASDADGFESLLDMMLPFAKSFHLNWHYRSHDEALIAFSNHNIYKDRLVTFPGPGGPPAVSHLLVDFTPEGDGQEESCAEEVREVIRLVLRHAQETPGRTLGVIAMGIKHAMRLQGALDQALKGHPELAEFFDSERPERFFIKNLERVQGDERDSIIISVGYGKNRAGDLPLRFGPILSAGGRRRLNVAITRSRETMTVVSSFSHLDIDVTKVREGTGLEFLRSFLQYAASGGKLISLNEITSEPMNEFETDICTALEARGMKLVPQVGCSQFRIDFGVCHPEQPGRFVMAIECDGATYHSSATARDRDRLRQQMLENLGWSFHRIWSTDWFFRREEEIERAWSAYQNALKKPAESPDIRHLSPKEPVGEEVTFDDGVVMRSQRYLPNAPITVKNNIAEYSGRELRALYEWVMSDGVLRTHDEVADEMFSALPFARRGARIEAALRAAITNCESKSSFH